MPSSKPPKVVTQRQFRKVLRQVLSDWMYRWPQLLITAVPALRAHEALLRALALHSCEQVSARLYYLLWASAEGAALHAPPHWGRMPRHPLGEICLN